MKLWFGNGAWASAKGIQGIKLLKPETVRRVAVIRHAALGDMILTRPFLKEVRRCFPNAHITLSLVSNYTRGAPEDLVDSVHIAYGKDRKDVPFREQIKKAKELGPQDIIFDLAATHRSFWICLLHRSAVRIGFPYHRIQRKLFYDVTVYRSDLNFETDCLLDMLNILGFTTSWPPPFDLPGEVRKSERPYVVYFTSASTPVKSWPMLHFAELINVNAKRYPDHDHIVLKGRADWESIDEVLEFNKETRNVSGLDIDSLDETIALIKGAQLVVSNDTGIRHLAIAAGIRSVGIFFASERFICLPFRYWPRYGLHKIVLDTEGGPPSITSVTQAVQELLEHDITNNQV